MSETLDTQLLTLLQHGGGDLTTKERQEATSQAPGSTRPRRKGISSRCSVQPYGRTQPCRTAFPEAHPVAGPGTAEQVMGHLAACLTPVMESKRVAVWNPEVAQWG